MFHKFSNMIGGPQIILIVIVVLLLEPILNLNVEFSKSLFIPTSEHQSGGQLELISIHN